MTKVIIEDLDPIVIEKLERQAHRHGRSLQAELKQILLLAISDNSSTNEVNAVTQVDPLIGLFSGAPDLAEKSEEILQQGIHHDSGWSWRQ
jgi:plasmid stability protein